MAFRDAGEHRGMTSPAGPVEELAGIRVAGLKAREVRRAGRR